MKLLQSQIAEFLLMICVHLRNQRQVLSCFSPCLRVSVVSFTVWEHPDVRKCPIIQRAKQPVTKWLEQWSKAMSMNAGARTGRDAEINVTPLIDILLVLLIIFMVILPPHELGEVAQIPQPNPDNLAPKPDEPVVIQLKDLGEGKRPDLSINQKQVRWDELGSMLETVFRSRGDRTAFVKGDPDIEFSFVAEALDITHRAGAERVGLLGKLVGDPR